MDWVGEGRDNLSVHMNMVTVYTKAGNYLINSGIGIPRKDCSMELVIVIKIHHHMYTSRQAKINCYH